MNDNVISNKVYRNQFDSYNYFWTGNENKTYHHSCFKEIFYNKMKDLIPLNIDDITTEWKNEEKSILELTFKDKIIEFNLPTITSCGTFLTDNGTIERAFILNLISSPGLFFRDSMTYIKPFENAYWIKFFPSLFKYYEDNKGNKKNRLIPKLIPKLHRKKIIELRKTNDNISKLGYVEIKGKKHLLTPLFLYLLGIPEKEIIEIYENIVDEEIIKELLLYKKSVDNIPSEDMEEELFDELINHIETLYLARSGRWQLNRRLCKYEENTSEESLYLTIEDIKKIVKILLKTPGKDDLTCLSNQIVLQIGDYLEERISRVLLSVIKDLKGKGDNEIIEYLLNGFKKRIESSVTDLITLSPLSQVMPSTNILYDVNYQKRITRSGPGGVSKSREEIFETRDIHHSYYGRLCPMDTPQSEKLGLVLSLAEYAGINEYGILEAPYFTVEKGKITEEIEWFTPDKENDICIAFGDQREGNCIKNNGTIYARKGKEELIEISDREKIDCIDYSPLQAFSMIPQLIPFLPHNDPARLLIATTLLKQAIPLKEHKELPLIYTGLEEEVAKRSGKLIFDDNRKKQDLKQSILGILKGFEARKEEEYETIIDGKKLLAEAPTSKDGTLAMGTNLLCAYVPWYGYNSDDAIVISESASKKLTSRHFDGKIEFLKSKKIKLLKDNPFYSSKELEGINDKGIITKGSTVEPGKVLISAVVDNKDYKDWMECFSLTPFEPEAMKYKDASIKTPDDVYGKVENIIEKDNSVEFEIRDERIFQTGDKITNRYGGKGVVSFILPDNKMPYFYDAEGKLHIIEVILNPLGVISRLNIGQILETHLGWAAKKLGGRFKIEPFGKLTFEAKNNNKTVDKANAILNEPSTDSYDIVNKIKKIISLVTVDDFIEVDQQLRGMNKKGKVMLYDPSLEGKTLEQPVVAGYQYFMKLIQQAEEKFHFRRAEPNYSLITEQPPKGKKHMGGQRVGEMEVWALQSHRAFHILEEMFTAKSDNIIARESLNISPERRGTSESVKAFIYYLRGLGIKVILSDSNKIDITEKIIFDECLTSEIRSISLEFAEDDDIEKWSSGEVTSSGHGRKYGEFMAEEQEGLFSKDIFGDWRKNPWKKEKKITEVNLKSVLSEPEIEAFHQKNFDSFKDEIKRKLKRIFTEKSVEEFLNGLDTDTDYKESLHRLEPDYLKQLRTRMGHIKLPYPIVHPVFDNKISSIPVLPFAYRPLFKTENSKEYLPYDLNKHYERILYFKKCIGEFQEKIKKIKDKLIAGSSIKSDLKELIKEYKSKYKLQSREEKMVKKLMEQSDQETVNDFSLMLTKFEFLMIQNYRFRLWISVHNLFNNKKDRQVCNEISEGIIENNLRNLNFTPQKLASIKTNKKLKTLKKLNEYLASLRNLFTNQEINLIKTLTIRDRFDKFKKSKKSSYSINQKIINKLSGVKFDDIKIDYLKALANYSFLPGDLSNLLELSGLFTDKEIEVISNYTKSVTKTIYPHLATKGIPLKSIGTLLEKKEGHFRNNMLGKRVDFSGRAVIAVNPDLNIDETFIAIDELKKKKVLLNRQPSLHKMSILSFDNIFNNESSSPGDKAKVIYINPLVTKPFGADFDGDTMAFYIPLGDEAVKEADTMVPSRNYLSPASGHLCMNVDQDIKLGIAYANKNSDLKEELSGLGLSSSGELDVKDFEKLMIELLARGKKDELRNILKTIYKSATISGTTFSIFDLPEKDELTDFSLKKYTIDNYPDYLDNNTLFTLYPAKARGNEGIFLQLCREKGGVARIIPYSDEKTEPKLKSCYLEGLTTGEYYYANYGSRKTHADKKLGTGRAGELSRYLTEAVYDIEIAETDCGTKEGIEFNLEGLVSINKDTLGKANIEPDEKLEKLFDNKYLKKDLEECLKNLKIKKVDISKIMKKAEVIKYNECILGRYLLCEGITSDEPLTEVMLNKLLAQGKTLIHIRSPLTCKSKKGICSKCYGYDLSKGEDPASGMPAGLIAAQSIGERGTQLQLKTIHTGGAKTGGRDINSAKKLFLYYKYAFKEDNSDVLAKKFMKEVSNFLTEGRYIYSGALNDIHLEIILKSMITRSKDSFTIKGLKSVVSSQDVIKSMTFGNSPLKILKRAIKRKEAITQVKGFKMNLLFSGGL